MARSQPERLRKNSSFFVSIYADIEIRSVLKNSSEDAVMCKGILAQIDKHRAAAPCESNGLHSYRLQSTTTVKSRLQVWTMQASAPDWQKLHHSTRWCHRSSLRDLQASCTWLGHNLNQEHLSSGWNTLALLVDGPPRTRVWHHHRQAQWRSRCNHPP